MVDQSKCRTDFTPVEWTTIAIGSHNGHTELASKLPLACDYFSVDDHRTTDAGATNDKRQIIDELSAPYPNFGERRTIAVIFRRIRERIFFTQILGHVLVLNVNQRAFTKRFSGLGICHTRLTDCDSADWSKRFRPVHNIRKRRHQIPIARHGRRAAGLDGHLSVHVNETGFYSRSANIYR